MHQNGEHIPFLQKMRDGGRETPLDTMPELTELEASLWKVYCFTADSILPNLDIYERRIGLPEEFDFEDHVDLVSTLAKHKRQLEKAKGDD